MPYEMEFVPIEKGIGIINTTTWNQRDLLVSWGEKGGKIAASKIMKGSQNECVIDGLTAGITYALQVRRADLLGRIRYKSLETAITIHDPAPKYVILVGASVGKSWDLPSLPKRASNSKFVFGYRGIYRYDKTPVLEWITRSQIKPDIVIIKECAAYLPKEQNKIIEKIPGWVSFLREREITPALATCCPVTEENDSQNPGRQDAINKCNTFTRSYARENGVGILDLQKVLEASDTHTFLKDIYAQPDGLHLTPKAYDAMDSMLIQSLLNEGWQESPGEEKGS